MLTPVVWSYSDFTDEELSVLCNLPKGRPLYLVAAMWTEGRKWTMVCNYDTSKINQI